MRKTVLLILAIVAGVYVLNDMGAIKLEPEKSKGLALTDLAQIHVGSDTAKYFLMKREGRANFPIITYRREGQTISWGKREFDCQRALTRYIAYGDTPSMTDEGMPEPEMYPIEPASIASYLRIEACS